MLTTITTVMTIATAMMTTISTGDPLVMPTTTMIAITAATVVATMMITTSFSGIGHLVGNGETDPTGSTTSLPDQPDRYLVTTFRVPHRDAEGCSRLSHLCRRPDVR